MEYLDALYQSFEAARNIEDAEPMAKYMKNHFEFLGIKRPIRDQLQRAFFKTQGLPSSDELDTVILDLWRQPEREYQYFALDLLKKCHKTLTASSLDMLKTILTEKSWWDTVDLIAAQLIGPLVVRQPELKETMDNWSTDRNLWLRRTALLYQLKYKANTDTKRLTLHIESNLGSDEFFINKAIGWVLREYGKTNPKFVVAFVDTHPNLANLSKREALRIILKK
jgi:3-methyladenine DNA glycosylase AlkD